MNTFTNEPLTDFSKAENKNKMLAALEKVSHECGKTYPLIINGEEIMTKATIQSINPSNVDQTIGIVSKASKHEAEKALEAAYNTFTLCADWKSTTPKIRADYCFKAAQRLQEQRFEFAAWMTYEVGKNWAEADADVAEAIDFLNFYGHEAIRFGKGGDVLQYPGEKNELVYIPLGVCVVIPPWNFPLAILVGMTSAAFVTGNTVVLKPSSETPVIAYKFVKLLEEIGLPPGVVNYVPGSGSEVGDYLVTHPKTRMIAFTGSKDVGLHINELAAKTAPTQKWIKRVIVEMGGKDTIIVDKDCNFESAVDGVIASAFGFSGQKCSACSRVVIDESLYDKFIEQLVQKAKTITIDEAQKNPPMGPVSSKQAFTSILNYIEIGKKEGELVLGGKKIEKNGYYIEPTIIKDVSPTARIAQEEIFGPVLACIKSKSFDESLAIVNNTMYGLTGAVYSNNKKNLDKAKHEFYIGNLYLNRKCTGALVGVHPFGGFNMSGTDSKAGGNDYLLLFLQAKSIAEKENVPGNSR